MNRSCIEIQGIEDTVKKIETFRSDMVQKTLLACEKLADLGITIARAESLNDSHKFYKMVVFEKRWRGGSLYMIGRNSDLSGLHTEWYDGDGNYHRETISPILALEYGTAGKSIKGYQGSAAVTGNHISDTTWYYYEDKERTKKHYATAEEARQPMYKALTIMRNQIKQVMNEVFYG